MSEWIIFLVLYLALQALYACYEGWADSKISKKGLGWAMPLALVVFVVITVPTLVFNSLFAWLYVNPYYEEIWDAIFWIAGVAALFAFFSCWAYGQTREYDEDMHQMRRNIHK